MKFLLTVFLLVNAIVAQIVLKQNTRDAVNMVGQGGVFGRYYFSVTGATFTVTAVANFGYIFPDMENMKIQIDDGDVIPTTTVKDEGCTAGTNICTKSFTLPGAVGCDLLRSLHIEQVVSPIIGASRILVSTAGTTMNQGINAYVLFSIDSQVCPAVQTTAGNQTT